MAAAPLRKRIQRLAHGLDARGQTQAPISTGATFLELTRAGFLRSADRQFYYNGHLLQARKADVALQGVAVGVQA